MCLESEPLPTYLIHLFHPTLLELYPFIITGHLAHKFFLSSVTGFSKLIEPKGSIIPSKEHPGLISFRMDWLDLLAVQGTLKSLLQHHSSKGSILQHSAFFIVQLSHPYMTTGVFP